MHVAERMQRPQGYTTRPYTGRDDHPPMTRVLAEYRQHLGDPELPTVEQFDRDYVRLDGCDVDNDIAIIETADDEVVGYVRASFEDLEHDDGHVRDLIVFSPTQPDHIERSLFEPLVEAQERHMRPWADGVARARLRAYAPHPGPDRAATGEAAWLEALGYVATEWEASLVRPDLDDIPDRRLPEGVELRPVTADQLRTILDAHMEAFRGEWDFKEATENDYAEIMEFPYLDPSLWKVAWAGEAVVGQVKSYINPGENAVRGYRRGYTEYISTHHDWRNLGIAGALLAMSLGELRDRGMTEAALGVDTNNPGGAFQLYTSLDFELQSYEAVYTKPVAGSPSPSP
jgi:ribosomal protein S18 acetylase RimI-like enzyme